MKKNGQCLCGKITFTINDTDMRVDACHCEICRKWTAGPFLSISAGKGATVSFENENEITRYSSSQWAERGFCKNCGSTLFYHGLDDDSYYIAVDLLDDNSEAILVEEIFYDKKPNYYHFLEATTKKTASEV